nr:MAG TPA: hypothetical protein [Caudoviricetes sp.]
MTRREKIQKFPEIKKIPKIKEFPVWEKPSAQSNAGGLFLVLFGFLLVIFGVGGRIDFVGAFRQLGVVGHDGQLVPAAGEEECVIMHRFHVPVGVLPHAADRDLQRKRQAVAVDVVLFINGFDDFGGGHFKKFLSFYRSYSKKQSTVRPSMGRAL